jgi:hypothetical protein
MEVYEAHDPLVALLRVHHVSLAGTIVRRARAEAPGYGAMPVAVLTERIAGTLDTIGASLEARDPSLLAHYLEDLVRARLKEGLRIEALLLVWQLIEEALHELVVRELAAEPEIQAAASRRIDAIVGTGRHVVGRVHLAEVVNRVSA